MLVAVQFQLGGGTINRNGPFCGDESVDPSTTKTPLLYKTRFLCNGVGKYVLECSCFPSLRRLRLQSPKGSQMVS